MNLESTLVSSVWLRQNRAFLAHEEGRQVPALARSPLSVGVSTLANVLGGRRGKWCMKKQAIWYL